MKTMHTPEPWHIGAMESGQVAIDGPNCEEVTGWLEPENARRIVAAINACEGISTELLEGAALMARHIKGRERLSAYTARVEAQRDQLLAALEAVLANCLDAEGLSAAYANARAAIAAVKGGAA